jgi:hypothetical protein
MLCTDRGAHRSSYVHNGCKWAATDLQIRAGLLAEDGALGEELVHGAAPYGCQELLPKWLLANVLACCIDGRHVRVGGAHLQAMCE